MDVPPKSPVVTAHTKPSSRVARMVRVRMIPKSSVLPFEKKEENEKTEMKVRESRELQRRWKDRKER